MSAPSDPLRVLAELERRYDGPIPPAARAAALLGPARAVRRRHAAAQAHFFAALAKGQIGAIGRRLADGSLSPALLADLALYRREEARWRRLQNEAESPPSTVRT